MSSGCDRESPSRLSSGPCELICVEQDALGIEQYAIFGESILGVGGEWLFLTRTMSKTDDCDAEAVSIAIQRPRAVLALALASPGYRNE